MLGPDLAGAADALGEADYYTLSDVINASLAKGALTDDVSRAGVRDAIMAAIAPIRTAHGRDAADPEVAAWNAAARDAMKIIRREA